MRNVDKIINNYSVISFDLFDTLIRRQVDNPEDIFYLVGYDLFKNKEKAKEFQNDRILAEQEARKKYSNQEINLNQIYSCMDGKKYDICLSKQLEIDCELKMIKPIQKMIESFEYAKKQDKKVYLISDMYLPTEVIEKMLIKCNIKEYKKLYVSCDYNCNKLTGKLFKLVIKENKIDVNEMIHFGDSIKADCMGAKKAGIKYHLIHRKNRLNRILGRLKRKWMK